MTINAKDAAMSMWEDRDRWKLRAERSEAVLLKLFQTHTVWARNRVCPCSTCTEVRELLGTQLEDPTYQGETVDK